MFKLGQHVIYKTLHGLKIRCKVVEYNQNSLWGDSVVLEVIYKDYPNYPKGTKFTTYAKSTCLYSA